MKTTTDKIKQLLAEATISLEKSTEKELGFKISPEKWSKKEILGHLIDSAIHNLQRFTEIAYESQPYLLRKYEQNELVEANKYNDAPIREILTFWQAINQRIIRIIEMQTKDTLALEINLGEGEMVDLRFLMEDYAAHMEHHLKQIIA